MGRTSRPSGSAASAAKSDLHEGRLGLGRKGVPIGNGFRGADAFVANSLRLPCVADELRVFSEETALADCLRAASVRQVPVTVIGGGSNVVLRAKLPGLTVRPHIRGLSFERLDARRWRVAAGAGETWHEVVRASLGRGIAGLENLALIPGSVGAAPLQNIGAYGRELASVLESVTAFDQATGDFATFSGRDCKFRYRDSRFKSEDAGRYVIVRVTLILGDAEPETGYPDVRRELARMGVEPQPRPGTIAEAVVRVRRRKLPDPRRVGNVGSFFKNPQVTAQCLDAVRARIDIDGYPLVPSTAKQRLYKIPAARLIDRAGWKGARFGAVQVWPRQPLVLVNHGGASAQEVLDLARRIQADVMAKYGVPLEMEPVVEGVD